eukprot:SAG31_NODE_1193_length_9454_cov_38.779156_11_plen_130_part_00
MPPLGAALGIKRVKSSRPFILKLSYSTSHRYEKYRIVQDRDLCHLAAQEVDQRAVPRGPERSAWPQAREFVQGGSNLCGTDLRGTQGAGETPSLWAPKCSFLVVWLSAVLHFCVAIRTAVILFTIYLID